MSSDPGDTSRLRISDDDRFAVAELLREAAGDGRIDLEELDERLEAAYAAKTYADLVPITLDLPGRVPAVAPTRGPAPASGTTERHVAIMSGIDRTGVWSVPAQTTIVCLMGGADLDLREATFAAPEVVITISAVMGGATIVVGPDTRVSMEGVGIMGGFSGPRAEAEGLDGPLVRVRGFALMGGVSVIRKD